MIERLIEYGAALYWIVVTFLFVGFIVLTAAKHTVTAVDYMLTADERREAEEKRKQFMEQLAKTRKKNGQ